MNGFSGEPEPKPETGEVAPAAGTVPLPLSQPRFTYILLAINVAVWLAMTAMGGSTNTGTLIRFGAKVNDLIVQGQYWRLLTSIFLHAGIAHLGFNMYALYVLGLEVERLYGHKRFLVLYFMAGLFGSVLSFNFGARISVGASGAIFGLAAALMAFFARHREMFGRHGRQQLLNIAFIIAINLFIGFSLPGIDNLGHLGGLAAGLVLGWYFTPDYQTSWDWSVNQPVLHDRNSLSRQWLVVVIVAGALVASTAFGVTRRQATASTYVQAGQTLIEQENYAEATKALITAVQKDPQSAPTHFLLGYAYSQLKEYDQALVAYQDTVRLEPKMAEAHWNLGLTYLALQRQNEARKEFETFLTLDISDKDAAQARAILRKIGP
ncbi:MAG: rhomboid family intramembrane serine protease [Chloroflexi bacterium]|nr:rhomboid family intramembrane serine protease [Chloroflexota bacterium]